jgi:hypothetical protein
MNAELALPLPDEFVEALALRIAELVVENLSKSQSSATSPWLDVRGVAAYASMTEQAVRDADKNGHLRSYRTNSGRVRFRIEDVDAFLSGVTR